ncbi:MAG: toxin-antitoxin system protein [Chthonomonadaceae bacterium]|nr:toxin-antitoxin system protein [Chthonomonadaceae bacterium]
MESVNVRVNKQTHQRLVSLAKENGLTMQIILDKAVEAYRRQTFLEGLNADFAALRAQPEEWRAEQEERELWETTLADGLEPL